MIFFSIERFEYSKPSAQLDIMLAAKTWTAVLKSKKYSSSLGFSARYHDKWKRKR